MPMERELYIMKNKDNKLMIYILGAFLVISLGIEIILRNEEKMMTEKLNNLLELETSYYYFKENYTVLEDIINKKEQLSKNNLEDEGKINSLEADILELVNRIKKYENNK